VGEVDGCGESDDEEGWINPDNFEEAWSAILNILKECSCSDTTEVRG